MASLFLKLGKGKPELAATDPLLHTFPCKVVSLGQDRHIFFQSIPYRFCIVIGVNKQAAFILIRSERRVEEGREGREGRGNQIVFQRRERVTEGQGENLL